jgi:hypothetical protein
VHLFDATLLSRQYAYAKPGLDTKKENQVQASYPSELAPSFPDLLELINHRFYE